MPPPHDLPAAARRHLRSADQLVVAAEQAQAGYLLGLAAECAVKAIATTVPSLRRDEVSYAHFPELRRHVLDYGAGREAARLVRALSAPSGFFGGWRIALRYGPDRAVRSDQVVRWRSDAAAALSLMEAP